MASDCPCGEDAAEQVFTDATWRDRMTGLCGSQGAVAMAGSWRQCVRWWRQCLYRAGQRPDYSCTITIVHPSAPTRPGTRWI